MATHSGGEALSSAELFSAGRFSEALNDYESDTTVSDLQSGEVPITTDSRALHAACNRAAAKLELEMCRSCLRDCDEAIRIDSYCLRAHLLKGQAYERLGKPSRAREAYEYGVKVGKAGGDVLLFIQLVKTLEHMSAANTAPDVPQLNSATATATPEIDARSSATNDSSTFAGDNRSKPVAANAEEIGFGEIDLLAAVAHDLSAQALPDTTVSAPYDVQRSADKEDGTRNNDRGVIPLASGQEDDNDGRRFFEISAAADGRDVADIIVGDADGDGSGDEADSDDNGSPETPDGGSPGGASEMKKKKKKKKKKKSKSKSGKVTWTGQEDEMGQRLTLRANKGGGGVVVEGLSEVLAASGISPILLEAARGQLAHAVGDPDVDNLIALGYLQVNTGNYRKAVELFRGLLSIRPGLVGAHLGLGSALALLGGMENAVASFSAAIEANPTEPDCWKRRGQTRAAMGHAVGALGDLNRAVELFDGRDPDVLHQRGMVYHKLRYFNRAVKDFREVVRSTVDSKADWNMIGLCRGQLGEPQASAEAYRRALAIDPAFKEAWTNLGSLLRDWGRGEDALAAFDSALALDSAYVQAYHLRGLCKHGMGDHRGAQADFMRGLFYDAQDEQCRYMAALCMHARGQLDEAARCYDALLSLKPGHQAWYTRECCVYLWNNIRRPWREFSPDAELDPEYKEGWCKRHDPMTLKRYTRQRKPTGSSARVTIAELRAPPAESASTGSSTGGSDRDAVAATAASFARPSAVEGVLRAAQPIGPGIQLTCPGFLSNVRQHRMFGLSSLEVAQLARRHWESIKAGGTGAVVPDAGSSMFKENGRPGLYGGVGGHPVGYRDVFDVAVRWRQLSEPNDPVWWIDRLTPEAFQEGFGLQTPMVNGQLKVIRYYPYFQMALDLMKQLMLQQSHLDDEARIKVSAVDAGLAELHDAVGHDHWVVTPCERSSLGAGSSGRVMEGTRLTIVASAPEGFEFTIRTPGTPTRWRQYDEELCAVWGKLTAAVCENTTTEREGSGTGDKDAEAREDTVCDLILELFYYWVNFGPLSRGSAACGYVVLAGLMSAAGWRMTEPLPPDIQMDWEAILRANPKAFMNKARPWLKRTRRRQDVLRGVPMVAVALPTALEAVKALNGHG